MTTQSVPFTDIERVSELPEQPAQYLENVRTLQVGFGSKVLRADQRGIWLGGEDPTAAAFSVDMDGNMIANSVTLTGYIAVGDALSDIGSGNITSTYLGSSSVTTSKINANAVTASKISVSELSAITADIGEVTSGTVTGALIRTSSSGDRVEIDDTDDSVKIYDSNDLRMELYEDRMTFYDDTEAEIVSMYATASGNFLLAGHTGADVLMSSFSDILVSADDDIILTGGDTVTLTTTDLADDVYIGLAGNTFMQFGDARVYMDVYFDMEGNDIIDGGDFTCVSLTETSDIRKKRNVQPLGYGLAEILKLDPIQYQFKKETRTKKEGRRVRESLPVDQDRLEEKAAQKHLGFSAQDVYKIMPELTKNADGKSEETARLYSTQIIPVLVKAVQELSEKVDLLQSQLSEHGE